MSNHTPGPWEYDGQKYIYGPKGEVIAGIRGTTAGEWTVRSVVLASLPQDANGRVLAAAPELLKACELALNNLRDDIFPSTIEKIRAAISKAK